MRILPRPTCEGGALPTEVLEPGFRDGDYQGSMATLMMQQGRVNEALAIMPRRRELNGYIPPTLWPKSGTGRMELAAEGPSGSTLLVGIGDYYLLW
jgi:hypothetical protein